MQISNKPTAVVITNGMLSEVNAKTAHGLIRGSSRFRIVGVLDKAHAGKDAGEVLDGKHRNIPVFGSISEAIHAIKKIDYCIIGVATHGGILPESFLSVIDE